MKKFGLILMVAFVATGAMAQKSKLTSAITYLKEGDLVSAKDRIDDAIGNEVTSAMPKTWFYKGEIYKAIGSSKDAEIQKLAKDAFGTAYKSYGRCIELDEKKKFKKAVYGQDNIVNLVFNKGADKYREALKAEASLKVDLFKEAYTSLDFVDQLKVNNKKKAFDAKRFAAYAADSAGMFELSIPKYKELLEGEHKSFRFVQRLKDGYFHLEKYEAAVNDLAEIKNNHYKESLDTAYFINVFIFEAIKVNKMVDAALAKMKDDPKADKYLLASCYNEAFNDESKSYDERNKSLSDAEATFEALAKEQPKHPGATYRIALINKFKGDIYYQDSENAYNKANYDKGDDLKKQGDVLYKKALSAYERHVDIESRKEKKIEIYKIMKQIHLKFSNFDAVKAIDAKIGAL